MIREYGDMFAPAEARARSWRPPLSDLAIAAGGLFVALALLMSGCASTSAALAQCNAKPELLAAAQQVEGAEAQALVCSAGDTTKIDACEEQFASAEVATAIRDLPLASKDVLACAADLIHAAAAAKTATK